MVNTTALLLIASAAVTLGAFAYLSNAPVSTTFTTTAAASPLAGRHPAFRAYAFKFGKTYESEAEARYRESIFLMKKARFVAHNATNSSYKLGETSFTDLTFEEFKSMYLMKNPLPNKMTTTAEDGSDDFMAADSKDWVKEGVVTGVKDQGQCGSCWAFSATGALESAYAIKNKAMGKDLLTFSESELVDCSGEYDNDGCDGGLPTNAFDYIIANKIATEKEYPYKPEDGTCKKKLKDKYGMKSYNKLKSTDVKSLVAAIKVAPVSVGFEVQDDFQDYSSGIYVPEDSSCGEALNHGVLAVGYNVEKSASKSFFKVKNSWGTGWGEDGFFRMVIGKGKGTCGIANDFDATPVIA